MSNEINIVNGSVVGVHLGTPMQDATPKKPEDNEAFATERNTVTRVPNSEKVWEEQSKPIGGGVSFKTFDLTLGEGVNLKLTDMGNDLVHFSFSFRKETPVPLEEVCQYVITADDAEFNEWFSGKAFMFGCNPCFEAFGTGFYGSYADVPFSVMMVDYEGQKALMMIPTERNNPFTDEKISQLFIDAVVKLRSA